MSIDEKWEELFNDPTVAEGVIFHAMDDEGLTYGEAVAMLFLMRGDVAYNNNPGMFKGIVPIED